MQLRHLGPPLAPSLNPPHPHPRTHTQTPPTAHNCVPCFWQMRVICLCELPITCRTRDTYHSKWGCFPPPFLLFLLSSSSFGVHVPADSHHGSSEMSPPSPPQPPLDAHIHTLQSHTLCNLRVQRTVFITALLILSSTLSSLLSPVFFIFLYSNKAASQKPSAVHPFSFP